MSHAEVRRQLHEAIDSNKNILRQLREKESTLNKIIDITGWNGIGTLEDHVKWLLKQPTKVLDTLDTTLTFDKGILKKIEPKRFVDIKKPDPQLEVNTDLRPNEIYQQIAETIIPEENQNDL